MAIDKLKRHKSPGIDQIPAELMKAGEEQLTVKSIILLILFGIRRNCLRRGRSRSFYLSISRAIQRIVVIIGAYYFCQLRIKSYPTSSFQGYLHTQGKLLGIISVHLDATDQLPTIYFAFVQYLRKSGNYVKHCINYFWTSRKPMIQLEGRSCIILSLSLVSP